MHISAKIAIWSNNSSIKSIWKALGVIAIGAPKTLKLSSRVIRGGGGGFSTDADVRTFWRKNFGFFEIYGVSSRRGLSQCGHFSEKEGQFFAILCGGPLSTAPT